MGRLHDAATPNRGMTTHMEVMIKFIADQEVHAIQRCL